MRIEFWGKGDPERAWFALPHESSGYVLSTNRGYNYLLVLYTNLYCEIMTVREHLLKLMQQPVHISRNGNLPDENRPHQQ